ncbi:hypothetical protein C8F04DRAFT_385901 [Mycena alexandri]|uniref:Arrestin-like N-terminal domain-containing protein n=1 Tax=Mycena alexandri TaxID=1745969 RepID=A0AAD6T344_9AGAR|nr:hypothetical protein C8F04DRAFT_385901 [Mycena alexandri]
MASTSPQQPRLITLHFPNLVRVAGETIEGHVDLNLPLARKDGIETLQIELRGVIETQIYKRYTHTGIWYKEAVALFSSRESLWTTGDASNETSPDTFSCPFRFTIPDNLPPSFYHTCATIGYSLEIVGERSSGKKRRLCRFFPVTSAASHHQLLTKESLRQGWTGPWREIKRDQKIRQGLWGDYSHVSATLSIPELSFFPIATPIPYSLYIVTETKTLDRSESKNSLFPTPPTQSSKLTQVLRRTTDYRVRDCDTLFNDNIYETFDLQKAQGLADDTVECTPAVEAVVDEPEWVPRDKKDRGIWRRSARFTSTITLPFAPTFSSKTLVWQYMLQFVVPFPGMKNDLSLETPIKLGPGFACPPPRSSNLTYADVLPAGPAPSMLDLPPPAYWEKEEHDWDDEKHCI